MKTRFNLLAAGMFLAASSSAWAEVHYVDVNGTNATAPYTNWATAAVVIQDAIDAADPGDEIVVTNGIYASGGRMVGTYLLVNRVAIDKPLLVRSLNGPEATIIEGYQVPGVTNGDGAVRCAYLTNGSCLIGFTLTNGATRTNGDLVHEQMGGGVWCEPVSYPTVAGLSNCFLIGNSAYAAGGGTYSGTLNNCMLLGNSASDHGGGAYAGSLNNCKLSGNSAGYYGGGACGDLSWSRCFLQNCTLTSNSVTWGMGGGAFYGSLYNCTLMGNSAFDGGGAAGNMAYPCDLYNCTLAANSAFVAGGADSATLYDCIIYYNSAQMMDPECSNCRLDYCCTTPLPASGSGNFTNSPSFVDISGGNLRLQSGSPCINAGAAYYYLGATDLDGRPRVVGGTVDIGAYEFQGAGRGEFIGWLQQYGLPTDGSADFADPDRDGLNNWQEWRCGTCPTNGLSALRLLSARPGGTNLTVTWQSVSGVNYFLECATNLSATPCFTCVATNVPGQPGTTTYTDTNAVGTGLFFYRVGVGN